MWNAHDKAFVELNGKLRPIPSPMASAEAFEQLIYALANLENTIIAHGLSFDGMLPDGSRFHATLPPLSPAGPTLTIRKFSRQHRSLEDLVAAGFLSKKLGTFLDACVKGRLNILISGATGAGKTTLLNCLSGLIDPGERIVTIEDIPELKLNHPNWARLLAVRDESKISVREALVGALRMRPDRIIIGECRSSETLEMLQAMNTGHDGGMTTVHANSTDDALTRLESLLLFHAGAEIPLKALRRQIADALDVVIQIKRGAGGRRYIEEVMEVVGMEGDMITRLPIFKRPAARVGGAAIATGHPPKFVQTLAERGVKLPPNFFDAAAFEGPAAK
jgi:pilus assembly protein CpaF